MVIREEENRHERSHHSNKNASRRDEHSTLIQKEKLQLERLREKQR